MEATPCAECGKAAEPLAAGLCPTCLLRTAIETGVDRELAPMLPKLRYFGDYELLAEVARGGMGVVYRARQVSLDRTVAVKMMRPGLLATEKEIEHFRAEARTAASLQHPNIVTIHEVGEFDGLHYFSMDFVEGPSLAEVVRERPLASYEAARYVRILAETIGYAHKSGILHRDLKPSNVLVDPEGRPRITDFGLARPLHGEPGASGTVAGTPAYMPPEQAAGEREPLGPATDVYSLGAILYQLLTGKPPFRGATQAETLRMVLEKEPAPPRELNPTVSRSLQAVCLKCLRKNPAERYASAAELAAALKPVRTERVIGRLAILAVLVLVLIYAIVRTEKKLAPVAPPAPPKAQPNPVRVLPAPAPTPPAKAKAPDAAPAVGLDVEPRSGRGRAGAFTFHYTDPQGANDIGFVEIAFQRDNSACNLRVAPGGQVSLQFYPDRGPDLRVSGDAGSLKSIENSVCSLDLSAASVLQKGNNLEVRLRVNFKPAFDGPLEIASWLWHITGKLRKEGRLLGKWVAGPPLM